MRCEGSMGILSTVLGKTEDYEHIPSMETCLVRLRAHENGKVGRCLPLWMTIDHALMLGILVSSTLLCRYGTVCSDFAYSVGFYLPLFAF